MKKNFYVLWVFLVLCTLLGPQVVLASPLTGADSDVGVYINYSMMGGYTTDTTDANDADSIDDGDNGGSDVLWTAGGNPDTQNRYFGHLTQKFSKILVNVQTATNNTSDLQLQYYNGSFFTDLTISSGATAFQSTGIRTVTFTAPEDWQTTTVNSVSAYYIRTVSNAGNAGMELNQISLYVGGGGGGESVPEFADYIYMVTLGAGAWYVYSRMQVNKKDTGGFAS